MIRAIVIFPLFLISFLVQQTSAQSYAFEDFVGTWNGYISSTSFGGYNDPMTMIIYPDHFYTETSGHLMPTIYPNTQECDYDAPTNRMHWWYLQTVYAGQYFYQHFYYEVVYFNNDTLEMHYNFWDDPIPHPEVGTIFLVRETLTPQPVNLSAQIINQSIQLNWTAPGNIPQGSTLQGYNVYYKYNNDPFALLGYTQGTSYEHTGYFQEGTYTYHVTAVYNNGESDPSNETSVTTNAAPVADFLMDNMNPATGDTVSMIDLSLNDPTIWNWMITPSTFEYVDGTGPASQNPKVRFLQEDAYSVELTVTNITGSDTKSDFLNVGTSVSISDEFPESNPDVLLYPNPATDVIYIQSDRKMKSVRITSMSGQLMKTSEVNASSYQLNVTDLSNGLYLMFVETSAGTVTKRILVQ
ncbi:T9SS type A sorting domain-containing protein [Bacteroidota bacterium]